MWEEYESIVERRIQEAMARGEFDHLEGQGKPLDLDDDALVPPEMRLAWRVLKNAGFVPEEVALRGEMTAIEHAIASLADGPERVCAIKRLNLLRAKLDARHGRHAFWGAAGAYQGKALDRFSRRR